MNIKRVLRILAVVLAVSLMTQSAAYAVTQESGSVGIEGKISAPPPKDPATITTPGNGQTVRSVPITVSGLCKGDVLVKIFSNNVFVGSAKCTNGSYSTQVSLFGGRNDLVARTYDALDQAGPDSNVVTVNFEDAQFAQFGTRVTVTSIYAQLGADPGKELVWPIVISGGVGPYAISVDWGDGTAPTLQSQAFAGDLKIKHIYNSAGIYKVVIKVTDANGTVGFLQLVGVANGKASQATSGGTGGGTNTNTNSNTVVQNEKINFLWWPMVVLIPLIFSAFWLGRRHEVYAIRKHLERSRSDVQY